MRRKMKRREDIESRENRMLEMLKNQKVPFRIEDVPKPPLIQARRVVPPARASRAELRKLEAESKEKLMKKTIEGGSAVYNFMTGKVYVKTLEGDIIILDMTKVPMDKIDETLKKIRKEYLK